MKNVLIFMLMAIVLMLALPSTAQQTSNTLPFIAVSQPSPPTLTSIVVQ